VQPKPSKRKTFDLTNPDHVRALLEEIRKAERRTVNPDAELIKTILSKDQTRKTRLKRGDPLEVLEALYVVKQRVERWLGKPTSFMEFMDKLCLSQDS